jgi:hypothetical protein
MKTNGRTKLLVLLLLFTMLVSAMAACGAGTQATVQETTAAAAYAPGQGPKGEIDYEGIEEDASTALPTLNPITVAPDDSIRKIISTVNTELVVIDVQDTMNKLIRAAEALGGYVAMSSIYDSGSYYYAELSLRVPSAKVEGFTASLADFGKVTSAQTSTDDITDSYYDIESRLKNAKAQEVKLLEIMDQANTVEDLLRVRTELDQVQERIEQFQGQLKMWDQLTALSLVNVRISAEAKNTIDQPSSKPMSLEEMWKSIRNGFSSSINAVGNFFSGLVIGLSYLLLPLLLLGVFALILFFIIRGIVRKQARKRAARQAQMQVPYYQNPPYPQNPAQPFENRPEDELKD